MKYLVLLAVLVVAYMWWRHSRLAAPPKDPPHAAPPEAGGPQDMVCCPICSVHLPRAEAVAGNDGLMYCSQEHRLRGPGS